MKKLLALLVIVFTVFLYLNRFRVFLRDPLAGVTRDGVKVEGARVMINYPNDILLQDPSDGKSRIYVVQHWNLAVGSPSVALHCLQTLACRTDADEASENSIPPGSRGRRSPFEGVTMTDRRVEFVDEDGALVVVGLR